MLIHDDRYSHPQKPPGDQVDNPACPWAWVFACWHKEPRVVKAPGGARKVYQEQCPKRRAISCGDGQHVPLELAEAQLRLEGWRLAAPGEDGGGWRCQNHA